MDPDERHQHDWRRRPSPADIEEPGIMGFKPAATRFQVVIDSSTQPAPVLAHRGVQSFHHSVPPEQTAGASQQGVGRTSPTSDEYLYVNSGDHLLTSTGIPAVSAHPSTLLKQSAHSIRRWTVGANGVSHLAHGRSGAPVGVCPCAVAVSPRSFNTSLRARCFSSSAGLRHDGQYFARGVLAVKVAGQRAQRRSTGRWFRM